MSKTIRTILFNYGDDFFIFNKTHFNNFTKEFEKIKDDKDWDVITLTPRGKTQIKNFKP